MPSKNANLQTVIPSAANIDLSMNSLADRDCTHVPIWSNAQTAVVLSAQMIIELTSLSSGDYVLFGLAAGLDAAEIEEALEAAGPDYQDEETETSIASRFRKIRVLGVAPERDTFPAVSFVGFFDFKQLRLSVNEDQSLVFWVYNPTGAALNANAECDISFLKLLIKWGA